MPKTVLSTFCRRVFQSSRRRTTVRVFTSGGIPQVENNGDFRLEEVQGRPWKLFHSPVGTAIACNVSCDFQMDKGIAKQFLKQYGPFDELIERGLIFPDGKEVGKLGVLQTKERHVYYLMTRQRWWESATYLAMETCLQVLRSHCEEQRIVTLAIPRLGAQCDHLEWKEVKDIIVDIFKHSSVGITAYTHR